jgi:hypothetical protein
VHALVNGDFSGLTNGSLQRITLYNPYTTADAANNYARQPFPNNQIPASMESPLAKYLYGITPLPTLPGVNFAAGNNWIAGAHTFQNRNGQILRVDHNISDKDRLFARFQLGRRVIASNSGGNGAPILNDATNLVYNIYPDRNGVLSWTHSFSPTLFSEFLLSDSGNIWFSTGTCNNDVDSVLGFRIRSTAPAYYNIVPLRTTYSASTLARMSPPSTTPRNRLVIRLP